MKLISPGYLHHLCRVVVNVLPDLIFSLEIFWVFRGLSFILFIQHDDVLLIGSVKFSFCHIPMDKKGNVILAKTFLFEMF